MESLQIDKKKARGLYAAGSMADRIILEELLGKQFFSQKITDRIKTFEDACAETGEDPEDEKFHNGTVDENAYRKLKVVARALNEGKVLSFANKSQYKWFPWFRFEDKSFRFHGSYYDCTSTRIPGGSRLCYHSEELSNYAGTQFSELYNDLMSEPATELEEKEAAASPLPW